MFKKLLKLDTQKKRTQKVYKEYCKGETNLKTQKELLKEVARLDKEIKKELINLCDKAQLAVVNKLLKEDTK